jgi:hypothetical protein
VEDINFIITCQSCCFVDSVCVEVDLPVINTHLSWSPVRLVGVVNDPFEHMSVNEVLTLPNV